MPLKTKPCHTWLSSLLPHDPEIRVDNEPGIIVFGNAGSLKKRRYLTVRIPESVLLRVHRRLRKASDEVRVIDQPPL